MAEKTKSKANEHAWVIGNWFNLLVFFLIASYACFHGYINEIGRIGMMYYFAVSAVLLTVATFNVLIKGGIGQWISLTTIVVNAYVLPFSLYAYGQSMEVAAGVSLAYLVISIAISPLPIGLAILVAGIAFAVYQKYYYFDLENATYSDMMWVAVAYISAAVLAFGWKVLIIKMYRYLIFAFSGVAEGGVDGAEVEDLKSQLSEIKTEKQLLKEEIAMHILEMKQISGQK